MIETVSGSELMKDSLQKCLTTLLTFALALTMVPACSRRQSDGSAQEITGEKISADTIKQDVIDQHAVTQSYIQQNMICCDNIYAVNIPQTIQGQAIVIETTISEDTIEEVEKRLPPNYACYDIDWAPVLAKFAVGTGVVIIVAVVAVAGSTQPAVSLFAAPARKRLVSTVTDALAGGAMAAVTNVARFAVDNGSNLTRQEVAKYTVEGFSDGYMWGAISGALKSARSVNRVQDAVNNRCAGYNSMWNPLQRAIDNGLEGVSQTSNGGISFADTEYLYKAGTGQKSIVRIFSTGKDYSDFKAANAAAGFTRTPDGYTWHHVSDWNFRTGEVTLELVSSAAHDATRPHAGGAMMYQAAAHVLEEIKY